MKTIEQQIYAWIRHHDRVATHAKIWQNGDTTRFQCCVGQESYGHVFKWLGNNNVEII